LLIGEFDRAPRSVTSIRFVDRLKSGIRNSEVLIFEGYAHAPLYESVDEFNVKSSLFL
jgi:pimeloyl-ACP methyl ester carboxylesterase